MVKPQLHSATVGILPHPRRGRIAAYSNTQSHWDGVRATNCNCAHGNLHLDPLRQNNDSLAKATVHITPNQVHHRLRISY